MRSNNAEYNTVRIHPDDYRYLKSKAHHEDTTIVDCVSQLVKEDKRRLLEEKIDTIEVLPFINTKHKEIFIKYMNNFPWDTRGTDNLVVFYTYAALGIFKEDTYSSWRRDWKDTIHKSAFDENGEQLVGFACVVLNSDHEAIVKALLNIDDSNLSIAKGMIQLKFNGIEKHAM